MTSRRDTDHVDEAQNAAGAGSSANAGDSDNSSDSDSDGKHFALSMVM